MNNNGNRLSDSWKCDRLEVANLKGSIRKRVKCSGLNCPSAPHLVGLTHLVGLKRTERCRRFKSPSRGDGSKAAVYVFGPPVWHVHEDHRRVYEGVFGIELGCKGARFVPKSGIRNGDG